MLDTRDNALGDEKACRKVEVVTRSAHGHGQGVATYPYLQRLFNGQHVFLRERGLADAQASDHASNHDAAHAQMDSIYPKTRQPSTVFSDLRRPTCYQLLGRA